MLGAVSYICHRTQYNQNYTNGWLRFYGFDGVGKRFRVSKKLKEFFYSKFMHFQSYHDYSILCQTEPIKARHNKMRPTS